MDDDANHVKRLAQYVNPYESINEEEDFHFIRFESLQRFNLANLEFDLAQLKCQLLGQQKGTAQSVEALRIKLEQYCEWSLVTTVMCWHWHCISTRTKAKNGWL